MNTMKNSTRAEKLFGTRTDGVHAVSGIVHMIRNEAELPYVREGEIIVAVRVYDSWAEQLKLAKAIIEDADAEHSVAQQLAVQYDLAAVVGVTGAMELRSGDIVTLYGDGEIERICEKRAPDSPMRVSVPAAVAARKNQGIITATNVVSFSSPQSNSKHRLSQHGSQPGSQEGSEDFDDHSPASGE